MKWILSLVITMPCICTVSQDAFPQENAERDAAIAELIQQEKMARAAIVAKNAKFRGGIPLRNSPEHVQTLRFLHMPLPPDPTEDFFTACWKLQGLSDDIEKYKEFDRSHVQPAVKNLQQYADARIPANATDSQRAKLRAAALVDIRHAANDFRASFPKLPARFRTQTVGVSVIFGPGSLFEKVMRQQGLLDS